MTEPEIWQILQTASEISVARIQVFLSVTVGVLIISTVNGIRLNVALLCILLSSYLIFGYINFSMTIIEMKVVLAAITQIQELIAGDSDISLMGHYIAEQLQSTTGGAIIPAMHISYWTVTVATMMYSIWRYGRQSREG